MIDDIAAYNRMRRSLLSIRDLDPASVDQRLGEMDAAIARLQANLAPDTKSCPVPGRPAQAKSVRAA